MREASEEFKFADEEQLYCDIDELLADSFGFSEKAFDEFAPKFRNLATKHAERLALKAFADVVSCLPDNSAFVLCLKKNLNIDTRSFSAQSLELAYSKQAIGNKKEAVEKLLDIVHRSVLGLPLPNNINQNDANDDAQMKLF